MQHLNFNIKVIITFQIVDVRLIHFPPLKPTFFHQKTAILELRTVLHCLQPIGWFTSRVEFFLHNHCVKYQFGGSFNTQCFIFYNYILHNLDFNQRSVIGIYLHNVVENFKQPLLNSLFLHSRLTV